MNKKRIINDARGQTVRNIFPDLHKKETEWTPAPEDVETEQNEPAITTDNAHADEEQLRNVPQVGETVDLKNLIELKNKLSTKGEIIKVENMDDFVLATIKILK